jgi:hypothetical protein
MTPSVRVDLQPTVLEGLFFTNLDRPQYCRREGQF